MKKLLLFLLIFPLVSFCQNAEFQLLKKINGIEIMYKKTVLKSTDKKDTWLLEVEYTNTTDGDLFYKLIIQEKTGMDKALNLDASTISNFASIKVENNKGAFSSSGIRIRGDKTRLKTDANEDIFVVKKGKTYTSKIEFKTEKGIDPVVTIGIINSISFTSDLYDFM